MRAIEIQLPAPAKKLLIRVFVDSTALHTYWHCHRLPSRSFSVDGRQFHVCARCTGLIVGMFAAPLWVLVGANSGGVLLGALVVNMLDGGTQLVGWRQSSNLVRFALGLIVSASGLAFLYRLLGQLA